MCLLPTVLISSGQVGLVDARADAPNVLHVPVPESGGQVLELSDVLPLDCLLMPVGAARQALEAAVEALAAAPGAPEAAKPPQQGIFLLGRKHIGR